MKIDSPRPMMTWLLNSSMQNLVVAALLLLTSPKLARWSRCTLSISLDEFLFDSDSRQPTVRHGTRDYGCG